MSFQGLPQHLIQIAGFKLHSRNIHGYTHWFEPRVEPFAYLPAGTVDDPIADWKDQAGFFGERYKLIGRYQPNALPLPTQQRLGAHQLTFGW